MVVVVVFSVAFVVALAGYAFLKVFPMSAYLYADARASARSARLLKKDDYSRLASAASFPDFVSGLKGTAYECECQNAREFHLLLERHYLGEYAEIAKDTPSAYKAVLDAELMRHEASCIKLLMKSKLKSIELNEELTVPVGSVTPSLLNSLRGAETVGDMAVMLQRTGFADLFSSDFWKDKSWEEAEMEIDGFVTKKMRETISAARIPEGKELMALLEGAMVAEDVLLLIRAKLRGLGEEEQQALAEATEMGGDARELVKVSLEGITPEALPPVAVLRDNSELVSEGKIVELEKAVGEHIASRTRQLAMFHPEGAYPIALYIMEKNSEKKALQLISKAVEEGMPTERVLELMA
ncbi:MAG: V-type ATPase subunit [Candidatus Diapherotrites archaeon]|nr:V-type ATPase subunit [Candidatus Diapherotrites archaeon]